MKFGDQIFISGGECKIPENRRILIREFSEIFGNFSLIFRSSYGRVDGDKKRGPEKLV